MPKGPRGEKRPADVINDTTKVIQIATGTKPTETDSAKLAAAEVGSLRGKARAAKMTATRIAEFTMASAVAR